MKDSRPRCGDCANMRDTDGYCPRQGTYVNALADAPRRCFLSFEEAEEPWDTMPQRRGGTPRATHHRSDIPEGYKHCPVCDRTLPLDAFAKCTSGKEWRASVCRECATARTRRYKAMRLAYSIGQDKPSGAK